MKTLLLLLPMLCCSITVLRAQWITQDSTLVPGGNYSSIGWPAGVSITIPPGTTIPIGANGASTFGGGNLYVYGTLNILSSNFQSADSLIVYPGGALTTTGSMTTVFVIADTNSTITIQGNYSTNSSLPGSIVSDHYRLNAVVTIMGTASYNDGALILDSAAVLNTQNLNLDNPNSEISGTINNSGTLFVTARPNTMTCPGSIHTANLTNASEAPWIDGSGYVSISGTFNGINAFTNSPAITMNINPANTGNGNPGLATLGTASPCNGPGSPLPVSLAEFFVQRSGTTVQLYWTTVTESNNAGFGIQRSANGVDWTEIAFVSSQAVNGHSSQQLLYNHTDKLPLNGHNYYRLAQRDFDGTFTYSSFRLIQFRPDNAGISIYPNPAGPVLHVVLQTGDNAPYELTNFAGSILRRGTLQKGDNILNTGNLSGGIYLLKVATDKKINTYKVLIGEK